MLITTDIGSGNPGQVLTTTPNCPGVAWQNTVGSGCEISGALSNGFVYAAGTATANLVLDDGTYGDTFATGTVQLPTPVSGALEAGTDFRFTIVSCINVTALTVDLQAGALETITYSSSFPTTISAGTSISFYCTPSTNSAYGSWYFAG